MVNMSGHCITEIWLVRLRKRIFNFIRLYLIYALQLHIASIWASLVAQLVKNPPSMQKTWVQSLGWEDPLEKGKANPLQYSGLENFMNCIVHGVSRSLTPLNDFPFHSKYKMVSSKFKVAVHSVIIYPICNRIYSKENSL